MKNINWKLVSTIASLVATGITMFATIADSKARDIETKNELQKLLADLNKGES